MDMALVRGREPFTALRIAKETTTWGTLPSSPDWVTVPLISEDLNIDRQDLPETDEITSLGVRADLETGRATVIGSITLRPRFDSKWWNMFCSNLGWEKILLDTWINGRGGGGPATTPTGNDTNTHIYSMNQAVPAGFTIQVWKGGPDNTTPGTIFQFSGCEVSELNFEQPNDNHAQVTLTFIGRALTALSLSGTPAAAAGDVIMKLRDLDPAARAYGDQVPRLLYRSAAGAWAHLDNLNTFTINFNRGLDFDDPNVDSPDAIEKPGPQEQRDVTISIEGKYEQKAPTAAHPYHDYVNGNRTGFYVQYVSATQTGGLDRYAMALYLPTISWTGGEANIDTGGTILYSAEGTALGPTGVNNATISPTSATTPSVQLGWAPATDTEAYIAVTVGDDDDSNAIFGPGVAPA